MSQSDVKAVRPLSPHLQIYKPILTMVTSILQRITGAALYFGMLLVAWWLVAVASGPAYYDFVSGLFGSIIGYLVLFGFTWALMFHLLGGLRHFLWDTARGMEKGTRDKIALANVIGSILLTVVVWIIVLAVA
ncbi:succinate dehydrogenase subunit C [Breoghania corrubedonensis]|uniref:Succinate dehydrogenase cytochrome b556 subunit n=1 Tax=Breoghania corrubedonensis TaxID=665038 RepID=A0A2T5VGU2_9HYPH|nr:succinate dehydrogenase, cytochrome b556 subunit [Breoghania corrubedonensis]PTW62972.1 succinate dehydrogenase subunit C [Breoghania corrubedonensis]